MSPLRKRRPFQLIKHIKNTGVSCIPTSNEPCSSTLHLLNFVIVVILVWVTDRGVILHKRKVSSLLKFLCAALQVATQTQKLLELALFVMIAICFDHSSVTLTHTTHIIPSIAPTYAPHCHSSICGQTPPV